MLCVPTLSVPEVKYDFSNDECSLTAKELSTKGNDVTTVLSNYV